MALGLSWCLTPLPLTRVLLHSSSAAVYYGEVLGCCTETCLKPAFLGGDVPTACGGTGQPPVPVCCWQEGPGPKAAPGAVCVEDSMAPRKPAEELSCLSVLLSVS